MAIKQLKDGRWICYYRHRDDDGKSRQAREYFGRSPEGRAAALARDAGVGMHRKKRVERGILFAELAKIYATEKDFSENSKTNLKIRLKANIMPHFGDKSTLRIDHRTMDAYVKARLNAGVKRSTVRREITDIKAILNFCVKRNPPLIPFNPVHAYSPPAPDDEIIIPPSAAEMRRILAAATKTPHLTRFIYLIWYMGARPGPVEVFSLTWRSVRFDENMIRIISAKKGGPLYRDVPIHPDLLGRLKTWHAEDGGGTGPIVHYRSGPVRSVKRAWWRALADSGIGRRLRPYDLRHHFATRAKELGADDKALAQIMGSSPHTIMTHYQHVSDALRRKTVALIPSLDPPTPNEKMAEIIDYAKKKKKIGKNAR